ncbi:hypothetical protein HQ393_02280 [Chitinibacter bivalviorum]|uniref:Uncharacterized protein n=1 Tax=Chitinibacter bivalviorum TaxID=2739434 RepID=A0A7H9BG34_9NEIS|nr:hypothetical protein [Chitinibacter bivalviorum]QLG87168.1 hypothetical protein HQ393_02280 [Chitinibacter bivalviorum]
MNKLTYFKLKRESCGFPPMLFESLEMEIAYAGKTNILHIFEKLGVKAKIHSSIPEQREAGKTYELTEFRKFPNLIPGCLIEQPGNCEIFGVPVYIHCEHSILRISLCPSAGDITGEDIKNAQSIEAHLNGVTF